MRHKKEVYVILTKPLESHEHPPEYEFVEVETPDGKIVGYSEIKLEQDPNARNFMRLGPFFVEVEDNIDEPKTAEPNPEKDTAKPDNPG